MKIRKIRFQNINSLRGEHEIDFTVRPLSDSQLFAITGPTGSGKSTILDVVALALFSQVPRFGKISNTVIEQGGALLTRNMQQAYASVEYQCAQGIYRSSWSISTNRNGGLRPYHMEIIDLTTNRNIDLKKSEVPGKNEELIGLSYDQFIKSIMLAQGEFAKFLKVNKSERGELLEKITGTGIYRALGKKAFEKKGIYAKALEDLRKNQAIYKEELLNPQDLADCKERNDAFAQRVKQSEDSLKLLTDQLQLRKEIRKIEDSIISKTNEIKGKKANVESFAKEYGETLKLHESTAPYAEKLEAWKGNEQKIKEAETAKAANQEEIVKNTSLKTKLHKEAEELLKSEIQASEFIKSIQDFQESVEELETKINTKQQEYRSEHTKLHTKGETFGFIPDADDPKGDLQKIKTLRDSKISELAHIKEVLVGLSLDNPDDTIKKLEDDQEALQNGKDWSSRLFGIEEKLKAEKKSLDALVDQEKRLPDQIKDLGSETEKLQLKLKGFRLEEENQLLRASLEEHRTKLEEGSACPLCGSLEHPWADHVPPSDNELKQKIQETEDEVQKKSKELSRKEEQYNSLQKQKLRIQGSIDELNAEKEVLNYKVESTCKKWLGDEILDWEGLITKIKDQKRALNTYVELNKTTNAISSCLPILEEMLVIQDDLNKQIEAKNKLFPGSDIRKACEAMRGSWNSVIQRLGDLTEQEKKNIKELAAANEERKRLRLEIESPLMELGFKGIEDAIAKRLKEGDYHQLKSKSNSLEQSVKTSEAQLKTIQQQLSEQKEKLTEDPQEALMEKHDALEVDLKKEREAWDEVKRRLKNHQEYTQKIAVLQVRILEEEKVGRKWEVLNQLIGDATGKKFNDFAQDLTLQRLLVLANNRLSQLIDRYEIASPLPEEDDSLVAVDNHMGGQRRSVKTLSGGETFILSLSLALALSDLAAKNVEINSLFIDEGFGTLDPETLDQTIDTLEKLQTESSKTIGIISHVEALKERIGTQIQLERNGQGYSSLKIV